MPDIEYYDGAYTGEEIDEYLGRSKNGSNPNLIANWYFVGGGSQQGGGTFPVNQRMATSYSGSNKQTINCWTFGGQGGSIALLSSGVQITFSSSGQAWSQPLAIPVASLLGKTLTLSVLLANGELITKTGTAPNSAPSSTTNYISYNINGLGQIVFNYAASVSRFSVGFAQSSVSGSSVTVAAVKLELGDSQTLAHKVGTNSYALNELPNFGTEVIRSISSYAISTDTYANVQPFSRAILWTNSNSSTSFASTEISGTAGFVMYHIVCKGSTSATSHVDFIVALNVGESHTITLLTSPAASLPEISFRTVTKGSNGLLTIGNCDTRQVTATSRSQNNANLIPVRVYGLS